MPSRASKRLQELENTNSLAARIVSQTTGEQPKNAAAVALGKLGASKGGKARAAALSKRARTEIARKAAQSRWKNHE
jgi:hypothetical protein